MRALSMDLRERILAAVHEGKESMPKIAIRFLVSHKMVQKLEYQWRDMGTLEPQTTQGWAETIIDGQAVRAT
ncbi:hypothetical protein K239x_12800 [Planctomycetes bacterium K23_9]|uniref:Transposase n=1 Tax=Stieleria marina TaxID=1930275 RepID=A0A517NQD9_9BACT|nr:hypothetical protein K239x_12800 [Planctomycetes bacterium K23_9]